MSKFQKLASLAVAATLVSSAAIADTFEKYGNVEGWTVYIDNEKQSCLIEAVDDAENVVQMGLTTDRGVAYVGVFVKGKTKIKKGEKEAVVISLDGNLYMGEATGMRGNITKGYSGGYVLSDDPQFVDDVARKHIMTVFPEKEYVFQVDLTGTYKAIEMARECNKKVMG
jgi:hypothetical protein